MLDPCKFCIVKACCSDRCIDKSFYALYLDHNIKKLRRFIFSKTGHKRKHIKEHHRKHYNNLIEKFNDDRKQTNVMIDRCLEIINAKGF